jgi:CubicO group peptidase (beta-lactamase class C family)
MPVTLFLLTAILGQQFHTKALNESVESAVKQANLDSNSSTSILILRNGKEIYSKEFGKAGTPKRYRIGSLTKQFTAGLIVQLRREGKLNLTDSITKWIPDVPTTWKPITVLQLLTHSSGIANLTDIDRFVGVRMNRTTPEGILQFVAREPIAFSAGEKYAYNNSGYCLLGLIAERIEKKPYLEQLSQRFFKPLGMKDTGFEEDLSPMKGLTETGSEPFEISMDWPYSAGAIISSPRDMGKWDEALRGTKLFTEDEKKLMWTSSEQTKSSMTPYGLGWILRYSQGKLIGVAHGGAIHGFSSFIARSMVQATTVIVLANKEGVDVGTLATTILRSVEPEYSAEIKRGSPPIQDSNGNRTKSDQAILQSILDGTLSEDAFDSEFLKKVPLKNVLDTGSVLSRRGSIKSFELVNEQNSQRTYLVELGSVKMKFSVAKNPDGKIIGMQLRPE